MTNVIPRWDDTARTHGEPSMRALLLRYHTIGGQSSGWVSRMLGPGYSIWTVRRMLVVLGLPDHGRGRPRVRPTGLPDWTQEYRTEVRVRAGMNTVKEEE